jgi:hypothetical protein
VEIQPEVTRSAKKAPQWLLEGVFIIVSVLLGFAVAQFGESRNNRELAKRALNSIKAEMEQNLAAIEPLVPIHQQWTKALAQADTSNANQSGLDIYMALRPPLPPKATPFAFLRRSAWDAALSGGALRLIDYDVAAALSEIYRMQEITTDNIQRMATGALSETTTYDPAQRVPSVRLLWLTLADIVSAEELLQDRYRKHLPTIRAAVER